MSELLTDIVPPIGRVTLNRPDKRNALNCAMWMGLTHLAAQLSQDDRLRVILLAGAGHEAFSAGADIVEMRQSLAEPPKMQAMQQAVLDAQVAWERIPIPTIAMIRGACTGGGCGLALTCDLRIATPDAFFAIPPANLGLAYSLADTKRLYDLVGPSRTKEILYTGRRIDATEALRLGMINQIVQPDELEPYTLALAAEIAGNAPNSVRAAKSVVSLISSGTDAETQDSKRYYDESFSSPEFLEGARAFIEKRSPKF
jgi:enoyl-CoA hydratase/carnithine racemase